MQYLLLNGWGVNIMRRFGKADATITDQRLAETNDEIWLLEHPPVYTLGQGGKEKHILRANGIPVIRSDRGGQVTYHGPGQIIAYVLLDIRQRNGGLRFLVRQPGGGGNQVIVRLRHKRMWQRKKRPGCMSKALKSPPWACAYDAVAPITVLA